MEATNRMRPVHPGEILGEELQELGMSANALAKELGVPTNRITAILGGRRGINADTALRLSPILRHDAAAVAEPPKGIRAARGGDRVWKRHRGTRAAS